MLAFSKQLTKAEKAAQDSSSSSPISASGLQNEALLDTYVLHTSYTTYYIKEK